MQDHSIGITVSGGQAQGIFGAKSVYVENLVFNNNNRAGDESRVTDVSRDRIPLCPYPGLSYFGPNNAAMFFGRDAAITHLEQAVQRHSLTALVGASGCGKSSVVLAGLAPRLQQRADGRFLFSYFRVGLELDKDPFLAMARAMMPFYVSSEDDVERLKNTRKLAASLKARELTLLDVFADCRTRNKGNRIMLIADQFEEVFTLVTDVSVRSNFIDVLLAGFQNVADGVVPDICLVLTLRADFYGMALHYRPLADALQGSIENLGPMNREELRAAIVRPADASQVSFEPGLVETLLDDVESKPGALPLLQFALREMWGRQEGRQIARRMYDAIGGVEGALAQHAEAVFDELTKNRGDDRVVNAFKHLFTRLVTLGDGQEDTRRVVGRDELGDESWSLAQTLANETNRLIVTNALAPSSETAEVAHEALIRRWPALVAWINQDRAFQSWLRQIKPNVDRWTVDHRDEGPLLRGGMLAQAEEWLANRRTDFNLREQSFIEASVALRDQEREEKEAAQEAELQRQKQLADAANQLAREQREHAETSQRLLVLAEKQTKLAQAREFLLHAEATIKRDNQLSLLLGLYAAAKSLESQGVVLEEIRQFLERVSLGAATRMTVDVGSVESMAVSPDGQFIAVGGSQGSVVVLSMPAGGTVHRFHEQTWIDSLAWTADGALLAAGARDQSVVVWDAKTGKQLDRVEYKYQVQSVDWRAGTQELAVGLANGNNSRIKGFDLSTRKEIFDLPGIRAAWSPRGDRIATGGGEGTIRIFGRDAGLIATAAGHERYVHSIHWDPEGRRIATASVDGTVMVWDADSLKRIKILPNQFALSVAWSPDGRLLASGNGDRFITIWETSTFGQMYSIVGSTTITGDLVVGSGAKDYILNVGWTPDAKILAVSDRAGRVMLYARELLAYEGNLHWISAIRTQIPREFTEVECRLYFHADACEPLTSAA
jgi:ABC-type oligopeptide transport system ATPase subunit